MDIKLLRAMLTEANATRLFPCIVDLVENGLSIERFNKEDRVPSRQDITQYLAAWCKYAGLSSEEARKWMITYCADVLARISTSSKSQIRHSTKGNIKYIYSSDVTFDCMCENNKFKASCEPKCPVFDEMSRRAEEKEKAKKDVVESYEYRPEDRINNEEMPVTRSVKEEYKEQFENAMGIAQQHLSKAASRKEVVNRLNADGFKTRTGKRWSTSILGGELKKLNAN